MSSKELMLLAKRTILKDEKYKRFKRNFDQADHFNLPIKELEDELLFIHNTRPIRTLKDLRQTPGYVDHVIHATVVDQANRSRLVELTIACVNAERRLTDGLTALTDYLYIEYATELSKWRTKDERKVFLHTVLRPFYKYLDQVHSLRAKIELVISDIDKAGYTIKNTLQALELVTKPQRNI